MKNTIFRAAVFSAFASLLAVSCAKESSLEPSKADNELHFVVTTVENVPVKSYLDNNLDGTYTPKWRKDDALAVFIGDIKANSELAGVLYNENADGTVAKFDGYLDAAESGVFKAVSPKLAFEQCLAPENGVEVLEVSLGDERDEYIQHPTYETIDEDCDVLVSKPTEYTSDGKTVYMNDVYFKRVVSIVKVNVKGVANLDNEHIHNFTMTSSDAVLTGSAKLDITNAEIFGWTTGIKSLTAVYSTEKDMPVINGEYVNTVFFAANPTTLAAGTKLTFSGETDKYTFNKEVTLPKDIVFPEGQIAVINLTLDETHLTEKTTQSSYTLVTNTDDLADGDKIVFVNQDKSIMASSSITSNYFVAIEGIAFNEDKTSVTLPDDCLIITLEQSGSEWKMRNADGEYLNATNTKTGLAFVGTTTSVWTISIKKNDATISTAYNGTTTELQWNVSANPKRLSNYTSNQASVEIYKLENNREALAIPTGLKVDGKVVSWNAVSGAASYNVTIGTQTFSSETNSYDASAIEDEYYDVAVVAVPSDTDNYKKSAAATLTAAKFGTPTLAAPTLSEGAIDETSIRVNWTSDSRAANGYKCEICDGEALKESKTIKVNYVVFSNLENGHSYTIKVNALAVEGEKSYAASGVSEVVLSTKAAQHVIDVTSAGTYTIKGLTVYAVPGSVNAIAGDETGFILIYKKSHGLEAGNTCDIAGEASQFNGVWEFNTPSITNKQAGAAPLMPAAVEATEAYLTEYAESPAIQYVHVRGVQSGKYVSVGSQKLYLSAENAITDGKNVEAYGFVYGYNTNFSNTSFVATSIQEDHTVPSISIDNASKTWASTATDAFVAKVTVNEGGDWTVSPTELSWATIAVDKAAGTITVTPTGENTSAAANEATLTVTHTSDANLTKTISLKQNAAGAVTEEPKTYTLQFGKDYNSKGVSSYTDSWTVTVDGFTWNISNWNNNNNGWTCVKAGPKENNSAHATIATATSIPEAITTIAVTIDKVTNGSITSIALKSSSTSDFSSATIIETKSSVTQGEVKFAIASPQKDMYYQLDFTLNNTTKNNGVAQVSKVTYSNE